MSGSGLFDRAAMRIGVVFGRFAGMVCRMKPVSVRDMRVVRGLFVVFFQGKPHLAIFVRPQ